jgi:hypothetical protein
LYPLSFLHNKIMSYAQISPRGSHDYTGEICKIAFH